MQGAMRFFVGLTLTAGLLASTPARAGEFEDNMLRLTEHQPPAVASVIHRLVECNRWAGDEPYDLRAYRHSSRSVRALRCDTVHRDERALLRRYAHNPDVVDALREAHSYIP